MSLYTLAQSHDRALEVRERVVFAPDALADACATWSRAA
jgi:hypothetical protein